MDIKTNVPIWIVKANSLIGMPIQGSLNHSTVNQYLLSDTLVMNEPGVLDIFKLILDEVAENDSVDFNITAPNKLHLEETTVTIPTLKYLVEGVLMFIIGCIGIFFNTVSVIFFVRQRSQKTFHR